MVLYLSTLYTFYLYLTNISLKRQYLRPERLNGLIIFCTRNKHNKRLNLEQVEEDFVVHRTHRRPFKQVSTKTHLVMNVTHCSEENSTTNVLPRNVTCVLYYMLCKNRSFIIALICMFVELLYICVVCCGDVLFCCLSVRLFNLCGLMLVAPAVVPLLFFCIVGHFCFITSSSFSMLVSM